MVKQTQELDKISRKLSKILRHDPTPLVMDAAGWVSTDSVCAHYGITMEELEWIVDNNDKRRFSMDSSGDSIRANQGHSAGVATDMEYLRVTAMEVETTLYHGTDDVTAKLIKADRILPGKRQHVHWTESVDTAKKRAMQRAYYSKTNPVLVELHARSYVHGGGVLLVAENDVYLTPAIDGNILKIIEL